MGGIFSIRGTVGISVFTDDGKIIREYKTQNDFTTIGWDWLCDVMGQQPQPGPISFIGIGWGAGASTPFDPSQTDLAGASTARKASTYAHGAGTTVFYHEAIWGKNEPATTTIEIEESGTFLAATGGTMVTRALLAKTPKSPDHNFAVRWTFELYKKE